MIEKANKNWIAMTDDAIVAELGTFIKKSRIAKNKTQAETATAAGINRWTISQIENGEAISLNSLIQILRALDALHVFNSFIFQEQISPLEAVKLKQKERKRVRNSSKNNPTTKSDW